MARITLIWKKSRNMAELRVNDEFIGTIPLMRIEDHGTMTILRGAEDWPLIAVAGMNDIEIVEVNE